MAGVAAFALAALAVIIVSVQDDSPVVTSGPVPEAPHVPVQLREFAIDIPAVVPTGAVLDVVNIGATEHDLVVRNTDLATPTLSAGGTAALDLSSLAPGTYDVYCSIPGHEGSGMFATISIEDGAAVSDDVAMGGHGADITAEVAAELDRKMMDSFNPFVVAATEGVPATEGVGNVPLEPVAIEADGTKVFELEASIIDWEVEPGRFVEAWAYNGMVPGPWIRADVGDNLRFEFTNNTPLGTDIHWHGITLPNDQDGVAPLTQPLIGPGESFTYEFTVIEPMVAMYHAHAHAQVSVPNGMFGAFTVGEVELPRGRTISGVEIPADLELVQEFPMVLNDAGVIGYSLDGKSFPATAPVAVNEGDWFLTHYFNEGLQIHPMHLHGFRQLVVARDGVPLDSPFWVDTLNVAPGERYSVLVQATVPGVWVWHCHILTHVERADGMFGMVTAVIVS